MVFDSCGKPLNRPMLCMDNVIGGFRAIDVDMLSMVGTFHEPYFCVTFTISLYFTKHAK